MLFIWPGETQGLLQASLVSLVSLQNLQQTIKMKGSKYIKDLNRKRRWEKQFKGRQFIWEERKKYSSTEGGKNAGQIYLILNVISFQASASAGIETA